MSEQAPLLRVVWRDLAERVAGLIRLHPPLGERLLFAPRRAVHAYAVAIHQAAHDEPEKDLAARLASTHPRTLLAQALPGCAPRLYTLLGRCGDLVRPASFYARLHRSLLGDFAQVALEAESIDDATLDFVDALAGMDPLVARVRRALDRSPRRAEALQTVLSVLHDQGITDTDAGEGLCGRKALAGFVRRQFNRLAMPPPEFPAPAGLRFLSTVGEVRALGRAHNNCLLGFAGRYDTSWVPFTTGTRVYLTGDNPPLVLCMDRVGRRLWWVGQMSGPANASLPAEVHERVERDLGAVGVQLLRGDPHRSLWTLLDPPRTARDDDEEVDEDEIDLAA